MWDICGSLDNSLAYEDSFSWPKFHFNVFCLTGIIAITCVAVTFLLIFGRNTGVYAGEKFSAFVTSVIHCITAMPIRIPLRFLGFREIYLVLQHVRWVSPQKQGSQSHFMVSLHPSRRVSVQTKFFPHFSQV